MKGFWEVKNCESKPSEWSNFWWVMQCRWFQIIISNGTISKVMELSYCHQIELIEWACLPKNSLFVHPVHTDFLSLISSEMSRTLTVRRCDAALYSLITHPKTTCCETLRKCLQRYRHTPWDTVKMQWDSRGKRQTSFPQETGCLDSVPSTDWDKTKVVQRPPKAVTTFDHPFIHIFKSFQKQSQFQAKQSVWTLAGRGIVLWQQESCKV